MAEFRKLLLAFAVVALLSSLAVPAFAQSGPVVCSTALGGGNPPLVRAEGLAELVGDVVLTCTGGSSTPTTANIPTINVQIFLSTDVTSRLVSSTNGLTEALLIIDEPGAGVNPATAQVPCTDTTGGTPGVCATTAGVAAAGAGTGLATPGTPVGGLTAGYTGTAPYGAAPALPNVYQGRWSSTQPNAITWLGVPFDPPGSTGSRILRITNIRGNASRLGTSSTLIPSQITEFISISGLGYITVNNPQATVAYVVNGLNTVGVNVLKGNTFAQCNGENEGPGDNGIVNAHAAAAFSEGYSYSWKVRNAVQLPAAPGAVSTTMLSGYGTDVNQNVPGRAYNTESGFVNRAFSGNGLEDAGRATQGTRLFVTFSSVPNGAAVFVPTAVPLYNQAASGTVTGVAILVGTDPTAPGGTGSTISPASFSTTADNNATASLPANFGAAFTPFLAGAGMTSVTWAQVTAAPTGSTGTASIVYEVVQTNTDALESMAVPFAVSFTPNLSQNLPAPTGTTPATLAGGFAPTSTVTTPSSSAPAPRFVPSAGNPNAFTIGLCSCNLLFPFVTNQQGFDTGVAVANTSMDPFDSTNAQQGTVTLNFYGTPTQAAQTTNAPVPAGEILTFTLSGGGNFGITPAAGFQGYIIAQSRFQYCHGLAFITAAGAGATGAGASESYLGIVLDKPTLNRTGQDGEVQAH